MRLVPLLEEMLSFFFTSHFLDLLFPNISFPLIKDSNLDRACELLLRMLEINDRGNDECVECKEVN